MSLRAIRAEARRALHQEMKVPAVYYQAGPSSTPRLIHVRVHTKWVERGDLKGTNLNYAESEAIAPRIVFDRGEVAMPRANAFVVISSEEGYRVGQTEPVDGFTITAEAAPLRPADLAGLVVPEDLDP